MTFYIKPPRGVLNLHILEECVKERLICYNNMKNENLEIFHFQYLVEDSSLDRTGHFMMRLLAHSSNSYKFDFIKSELKLLNARLNSYDRQDMKQFLRRLLKHSRGVIKENENESLQEIYSVFIRVFSFMIRNEYLQHISDGKHEHGCERLTIKVPFQLCLSLVAKREVYLHQGIVDIPCTMWKQLLLCLFETYLNAVLKIMKSRPLVSSALEDERIVDILNLVKNYNMNNKPATSSTPTTNLNMTNILEESKYFPLCMIHLFKVLEETNRLVHNDRFDFSLYMKGIGMSMSDSLKLWEHLYSKQHSTCSKCTHSWQKNEKKYIYGIRHLYGLEGSRKNYHCKNCTYMQEKSLGPREDGGCPFKQFDDISLRNILKLALPTKTDEIEVMIHERTRSPKVACRIFFENVYSLSTNKTLDQRVTIDSPVDYYLLLKREIGMGLR